MPQFPNNSVTESLNHPRSKCALCAQAGGEVLWDDGFARVVLIGDADHPAYCRVILNAHKKEMTDLAEAERVRLMKIVFVVERALRDLLEPEKVNLASFGNMVPHLHWHIIPRFADDPHFPNPVFGARQRDGARPLPAGFVRSMRQRLSGLLEKKI
ncbi:MAG TPA: HIT family protein [Burkholderiales bacterium]|jgi:diadenosine tetraphosphate (Ap4A) HIT family hydrolase|nr:HIT family protein [Burkholderiales bacterium]